ncbi:hypothetical protein GOODEAATRI_013982, partial [Goodea atripinnis]
HLLAAVRPGLYTDPLSPPGSRSPTSALGFRFFFGVFAESFDCDEEDEEDDEDEIEGGTKRAAEDDDEDDETSPPSCKTNFLEDPATSPDAEIRLLFSNNNPNGEFV